MSAAPINLMVERIRRSPPASQEALHLAVARLAIATFGVVTEERVEDACRAMARGLYGQSFDHASDEQRKAWVDMMERAYRAAL